MAKLDPKDPRNVAGNAPEVSDKDVQLGVYVFQPRNEQDEPVGEKKFLASNDQAHVEAFLHAGYRHATEEETKEYVEKTKDARAKARNAATGDDSAKESESNSDEVAELKRQLEAERNMRSDAEKELKSQAAKSDAAGAKEKTNDVK